MERGLLGVGAGGGQAGAVWLEAVVCMSKSIWLRMERGLAGRALMMTRLPFPLGPGTPGLGTCQSSWRFSALVPVRLALFQTSDFLPGSTSLL